MKKVAHFIDSDDPGGAETLIIEMSRQLPRYGYLPSVWHFGNPWLEERCREYHIPSVYVPGHRFYKSIITLPVFAAIFSWFILKQRIQILHSHLLDPIIAGSLSAVVTGVPCIGTLHDTYTLVEKVKKIRLLRGAALMGTRLITVSSHMKQHLELRDRFPPGAIQVILNGTDVSKFACEEPCGSLRAELGIGPEEVVLISVGRLVAIKGFDTLIESFSSLALVLPRVTLLIVGDGPERENYESLLAAKGLGCRVRLLGLRNDVPNLLMMSDCFVLASRSEGLSCSVIEAMAAGLPIIATDVGGNSELVENGVSGYLVPADNPEALAAKLKEMVSDLKKRRKFGEAGRLLAARKLSLEAMINHYTAVYASVQQ